ncbi:hypothetical protein NR800_07470 [Corallococcus interemptor]|uniref:hypothetical protein n=1 Tax=Corallococcus TaxID=83461 RepID=UPI001CBB964F|nr:hypothetical protein [Corallococcus sp. AS-1-12]MBZ4331814.1 hypothetical protein [Corallococcus sp. AS-1-12]
MPFISDRRLQAHLVDAFVATLLVPVFVGLLWLAFRVTDYIPSDSTHAQLMLIRGVVRTPFVFCLTCVFFRAFNAWEDVLKHLVREFQPQAFEERPVRKD